MNDSLISVIDIERQLQSESPQKIIKYALSQFENIAISFSGAEDVALIEMARNYRPDIAVFSLDTGRLHPETYRYIEKVRKHYGIKIEILSPDANALQAMVSEKVYSVFMRMAITSAVVFVKPNHYEKNYRRSMHG